MGSSTGPRRVAEIMLSRLHLELVSCTELQALWAGYGHICSVKARPNGIQDVSQWQSFSSDQGDGQGKLVRLILKHISPPGRNDEEGHLRKMFSYEVEQHFYDEVVPRLDVDVAVAKCLASTRGMTEETVVSGPNGLTAILMSDLRLEYPISGEKRAFLSKAQVYAALEWLARFHSSSWTYLMAESRENFLLPPLKEEFRRQHARSSSHGKSLWLNGGYTYLATRRKEYADLAEDKESEWSDAFCGEVKGAASSLAEMVADFLTPSGRAFETLLHGDVKSENLFSNETGDKVAFFDFQYTGIGLGVCDLAKLFTCSVPLHMLTTNNEIPKEMKMDKGERELLEHYRDALLTNQPTGKNLQYEWDIFARHWESALVDWCRFQASWGFWGNTKWLEARVRSILQDQGWHDWLHKQS